MTVREIIAQLEKIEDKGVPVFFDCPNCGRANTLSEIDQIVLVRTRVEIPDQ
jgi:hypothetical protein